MQQIRTTQRFLSLYRFGEQCIFEGADNRAAHQILRAKSDFAFRRMHIHIDLLRRDLNKQQQHRKAIGCHHIAVSGADQPGQATVTHRPAIDIDELPEAIGAAKRRWPRQTRDAQAVAVQLNR